MLEAEEKESVIESALPFATKRIHVHDEATVDRTVKKTLIR